MNQLNELKSYAENSALKFAEKMQQKLDNISDPIEFADWLIRYDYFNRGFPGAALELSGRIAFMDRDFGDIGAEEVSSGIIAAITDEFISRETMETSLHSSLRRKLVLRTLQFLSNNNYIDIAGVQQPYSTYRNNVMRSTRLGYGLTDNAASSNLPDIVSGIAFFMASETSGAQEFTVLNRCMSKNWPELVKELAEAEDEGGRELYRWVVEHQDLESDHARFAFGAMSAALNNYESNGAGTFNGEDLLTAARKGIGAFFKMADDVLLINFVPPRQLQDCFKLRLSA